MSNLILFNEADLFSTGNGKKKIFELPDLGLMLHEGFIPKPQADHYFDCLLRATPWREYQMPMYDKIVTAPRMVAWYGAADEAGETATPWTPELLELFSQLSGVNGCTLFDV